MTKFAYAAIMMLLLHRCSASVQDAYEPQPPPPVPPRLATPYFAIYKPDSVVSSLKPVEKARDESNDPTRRKRRVKRSDSLPMPPVPRIRGFGEGDMMKELQEMLLPNGAAVHMPSLAIAYGTGTSWYSSDADTINEYAVTAVLDALRSGFTHLDTAELYGTERAVGKAISMYLKESGKSRSDIYITAKATFPDDLEASLQGTLQRFGDAVEGYVDMYLLHSPLWDYSRDSAMPMEKVWRAMESLVYSGRVKSIGVSNFREKDLQAILDIGPKILPSCNQIEVHLYSQERELRRFISREFPDMAISAYGPLSPITGLVSRGSAMNVAEMIAQEKGSGATAAQVLLAWGSKHGIVQVTTTARRDRMIAAVQSQQLDLTDEDMRKLDASGEGCEFHWQHGPMAHKSYIS
ncbi:hypothetical protein HDU77_006468 [Chytriomyces hyalinus]|nr:hypothetical protein HDU77_006468 [Chytriomyces hyalinus]